MRRVPELDALRGIAALMVLSLHLGLGRSGLFLASAVDLFFVLSGYLITRIILTHSGGPGFLVAFYVRRIVRIWPIYYAVIVGFLLVNPLLPFRQRTSGWPYYLTFTQFTPRYWFAVPPKFSPYFAHTWTLAAEEQFYLLWPLVAVLLGRRLLLAAIPVLLVSAFVARLWLWPMLLVTNWDGFALGALLAGMLGDPGSSRSRHAGFALGFLALAGVVLGYPYFEESANLELATAWPERWGQIAESIRATRLKMLWVAIVGLVIGCAGHPMLAVLRTRSLGYLGTISYGLYLYHLPIFAMISPSHFTPSCRDSMLVDALKLAVTFLVAAVSWRFVEKPFLRFKDRYPYPRADPVREVATGHPRGRTRPSSRGGTVCEGSAPPWRRAR